METELDRLPGLMALPRVRGVTVHASGAVAMALAVTFSGCAGQEQSGPPAKQLSTWLRDGGGGSGIGNVEVASKNIDLALAQHNKPAAIKEVCALLSNDAQSAIGNLPTPDEQLTSALNIAYGVGTSAGDDCYNGAGGDNRLLARSAAERAKLFVLLAAAIRRAAEVTGQTPTTETTVPPTGGGDPFAGGQ
jgi:hypothetical protein